MIHNNLIFDLGFHNGTDTKFYLSKNFNVVAVESNPSCIKHGLNIFRKEINEGRLILLNNVIHKNLGLVNFFVNEEKQDWSSSLISMAESDGTLSKCIKVESTNIGELFNKYGVPYYMKVDIEGCDSFVAKELFNQEKPKFVSFEISKKDYFDIFSWLYVSGYRKFQLINQINNPKYSSGNFGDFLQSNWISYDELLTRYIKYKELKYIDNKELAIGWLDVHAMMEY